MVRFVLPMAFALLLPSCGSSGVSCEFAMGSGVAECADYSFSGDLQGQDVTALEQTDCKSSGGMVVDSCSTSNTLGICTVTASEGGGTLTGVEYVYAVSGLTAAQAKASCEATNGSNGITTMWSGP